MNMQNVSSLNHFDQSLIKDMPDELLDTSLNNLNTSIFDKSDLFEKETNCRSFFNKDDGLINMESDQDQYHDRDHRTISSNQSNYCSDRKTPDYNLTTLSTVENNLKQNFSSTDERTTTHDGLLINQERNNEYYYNNKSENIPENNLTDEDSSFLDPENTSEYDPENNLSDEDSSLSETDFFAIKPGTRKRKMYLHSKEERDKIKKTQKIQSYKVQESCKCRNKCLDKIPQDMRIKINTKFWNLDYEGRKTFVNMTCQGLPKFLLWNFGI
ncbi:uncharacterized protein LOC126744020 [Anthonomus grandis grandis]|uniref:uncharacterized protein LOC126744020 n=1 Tax=Anthonomus grandis grandis TaxID=2921223 RepID=UPI0021661F0C|nr:uncharacterized protein LOC126744020 [Anthonomus grandis grandis]